MKKYFLIITMCILATRQAAAADLPKILILATGGTIAGTGTTVTQTTGYKSAVLAVDSLIAAVPQLHDIAVVSGTQLAQVDSKNMTPAIWLRLAARINKALSSGEADGIVITHGTDTMEETAYFLNLTIKSTKPVVLTGAMRPSTALSADGAMNIFNAVAVASAKASEGRGVLVCLNDQINGAREVTKSNTTTPDAFRSGETGLLGYVQNGQPLFYRTTERRHTAASEFDVSSATSLPTVEILYGYAGAGPIIARNLAASGIDGLVHAGVGNGSIYEGVLAALTSSGRTAPIVVRATRVGNGAVTRNGEENDDKYGFVTADNLSPQKARILLMLALTKTRSVTDIQRIFNSY